MTILIQIYFITFRKYLHRFRTSKVDVSYLNTEQLVEYMVSCYFQITKKGPKPVETTLTVSGNFSRPSSKGKTVLKKIWRTLTAAFMHILIIIVFLLLKLKIKSSEVLSVIYIVSFVRIN
jgi:hypothetical protein